MSELQSHRDLHSFPTRRSSDLSLDRNLRLAGLYGWPKITRDWSAVGVGCPASGCLATCPGERCSPGWPRNCGRRDIFRGQPGLHLSPGQVDRKSTCLNSSHTEIYTLSLHDALPILASIGIYGLLAYMVGQRSREIGLRLALGAQRADVLRLVLGKGVVLAGLGIVAGVIFSEASQDYTFPQDK